MFDTISIDKGRESMYRYADYSPVIHGDILREPKRAYRSSKKTVSMDAEYYARLEKTLVKQVEQLRALSAEIQARKLGPLSGQMLHVYAWELNGIAEELEAGLRMFKGIKESN